MRRVRRLLGDTPEN